MRFWRSLVLGAAATVLLATPVLAQQQADKPADGKAAADGKPAIVTPKAAPKRSLPFPFGRTFVAVTYKDQAFKDDRPTFRLSAQNRATGFSACNNWSATVLAREDQRMAVGPVAITKQVCDARLMHNEQVFLFVFRTAQAWTFDGRTLTITGPYGPITMEPAA